VGAASKYGNEALKIATTVKLARALWIIPVSLITMFIFKIKIQKLKSHGLSVFYSSHFAEYLFPFFGSVQHRNYLFC
jgi:uncharacterized membrane protein YadS